MLEDIEKLLIEGNFKFQNELIHNPEIFSSEKKIPKYPILFLTCMDPRLDVHQIFQLNPGDVFILRNAGNIYTLDMMRSILITILKNKIKFIIVLGHSDCGMARINLKELREKLPNEFLKNLSTKYAELIFELKNFFKPFDNEIRNIINQINNLQKIKTFFPDIEITGMLYDTQTGWIFKSEDFRELLIKENHFKIYKGLLYEKTQQLSKFLEVNNNKEASNKLADKSNITDLSLKDDVDSSELEEKNITRIKDEELKKSDKNENDSLQIKMPKIQIPKINIPKIKIHLPNSVKNKDD